MTPYYADDTVTLHHGDALEVLRSLPDASVDAVVTDPPYGLEFMGREWDSFKPSAARLRTRVDGRTNPAEGKSVTTTPEAYVAGAPFQQWCEAWAVECLRVLKPGGWLLAFGGTRTVHRLTCGVEDAGFEIRDGIDWLYGSGFPKSLDVSKAIDKARDDRAEVDAVRAWLNVQRVAAGLTLNDVNKHFGHASNGGGSASSWMTNPTSRNLPTWDQWLTLKNLLGFGDEMDAEAWRLNGRKGKPGDNFDAREVVGKGTAGLGGGSNGAAHEGGFKRDYNLTAPATEAAARWSGWGTALKPSREPIVMARKPLAGTVAANVLTYGTGALNIDATRVGTTRAVPASHSRTPSSIGATGVRVGEHRPDSQLDPNIGRWPANVVLSHAPDCGDQCVPGCPVAELDRQSGVLTSGANPARRGSDKFRDAYGDFKGQAECLPARGADSGGASRFFPVFRYEAKAPTAERPRTPDGTAHPTVKPLDLMRWLVRLVTPPGGVVLEPFAGSGTTAEACVLEGFRCIAVEREAAYLPLIVARLTKPLQPSLDLFGGVA